MLPVSPATGPLAALVRALRRCVACRALPGLRSGFADSGFHGAPRGSTGVFCLTEGIVRGCGLCMDRACTCTGHGYARRASDAGTRSTRSTPREHTAQEHAAGDAAAGSAGRCGSRRRSAACFRRRRRRKRWLLRKPPQKRRLFRETPPPEAPAAAEAAVATPPISGGAAGSAGRTKAAAEASPVARGAVAEAPAAAEAAVETPPVARGAVAEAPAAAEAAVETPPVSGDAAAGSAGCCGSRRRSAACFGRRRRRKRRNGRRARRPWIPWTARGFRGPRLWSWTARHGAPVDSMDRARGAGMRAMRNAPGAETPGALYRA